MNKQQRIIAILRSEYERAVEAHRTAHAEHAAAIGGANAWDEFHPDDGVGGMSQNPFNLDMASRRDTDSRVYMQKMKEAYDFAVDTFVATPGESLFLQIRMAHTIEHDVVSFHRSDKREGNALHQFEAELSRVSGQR